ncbi:MAG: GNAT family N-acetyltransferase [Thermoleophilaceae bacterium]|nr:GNAT family N-acetyltransferase [Thermoleophilaceae bacterium]
MGRSAPGDGALLASVELLLADGGCEYILAAPTPDGEGEAICQLRYRHGVWYSAPDCWLEDLYVRPTARGRGLGGALIEAACARARARGCRRIELDTDTGNVPALGLYRRLGFSAKDAQGETRVLMRRAL